jgi:glycosyltransferase involved in cell wall biosynthesis
MSDIALRTGAMAGGIENQVPFLMSHLAARGHETTLVVPGLDELPRTLAGVQILSGWDPLKGVRGVRALTYRLPHLRRVLGEVSADAYYICGFSHLAPSLVTAAREVGGCSLLALASDADLYLQRGSKRGADEGLFQRSGEGRAASFYYRERGLRRASCVIAQTEWQLERCRLLGLRSEVVSNVVGTPPDDVSGEGDGADVIYVGSLSKWKGIDTLLELVTTLDDVSFEIVGPVRTTVPQSTIDRLLHAPNVRYLGKLPHALAWARMRRSRILVNTSPLEGFANVMLEAWAVGTPVVSLSHDPNGLLSREEPLGFCAGGSLADMVSMIRRLLADDEGRASAGRRAAEYVRKAHSPSEICRQFEELVGNLRTEDHRLRSRSPRKVRETHR